MTLLVEQQIIKEVMSSASLTVMARLRLHLLAQATSRLMAEYVSPRVDQDKSVELPYTSL